MSQLDTILEQDNKPAADARLSTQEPEQQFDASTVEAMKASLSTAQLFGVYGTLGTQLQTAVQAYNAIPTLNGEDLYAETEPDRANL
jgi:hypothetical protein